MLACFGRNTAYDNLDAGCIRNAALHTHGAAGLSGLDAYDWRRLCSSFKSNSHDLCKALAAVGRRLCTSIINLAYLSAFATCRLIPLNKCPAIGIGEVHRRIISKAGLSLFRLDIQDLTRYVLAKKQEGGCEAAVHAMRGFFNDDETPGFY